MIHGNKLKLLSNKGKEKESLGFRELDHPHTKVDRSSSQEMPLRGGAAEECIPFVTAVDVTAVDESVLPVLEEEAPVVAPPAAGDPGKME